MAVLVNVLDRLGFNASRIYFYDVRSLRELFSKILSEKILDLLSYVN